MSTQLTASEILSLFCSDSQDCRDYLQRPFLRGEFLYASNGHIAVRIPKQDDIDAYVHNHVPQIDKLFADNIRSDFEKSLIDLPEPVGCGFCQATGIVYKCPSCKGEGTFEHHDYSYDCKTCEESGDVDFGKSEDARDCFQCGGTGYKPQRVTFRKVGFDSRYLSIIFSLPGVRFSVNPSKDGLPSYFKFDGGEGLIMPRRK